MSEEMMSAAELEAHYLEAYGRDYSRGDDGYGDMGVNEASGWHTIAGWGRDGWDMGDWPYVMISRRVSHGSHEVLSVCEGDHTVYRFDTESEQERALNYLFCWYGAEEGTEIVPVKRADLDAGTATVDPKFLGRYVSNRSNLEVDGVVVASVAHVEL